MISTLYTIRSQDFMPYKNLALEELLLRGVRPGECILYLWQNEKTVVVGRNQNCRAECDIEALEADGGYLARRLSGGGAVFHDRGNLNFTFILPKGEYDLAKQTEVILQAVRMLGHQAERTGRNDIAVDRRKFSGNAFHHTREGSFHHGTIMVSADLSHLERYLTASGQKLESHGVRSVSSRVVNLAELDPSITVERVEKAMLGAFGAVYGGEVLPLPGDRIDNGEWDSLTEKFASWQWRIGDEPAASSVMLFGFPWGGIELYITVAGGMVSECALYTDALDDRLSGLVSGTLAGVTYTGAEMSDALLKAGGRPENGELAAMLRDIARLMAAHGAGPRQATGKDS